MYLGVNEPLPILPRDSFILFELMPKMEEAASEDGADASAPRCMEYCCACAALSVKWWVPEASFARTNVSKPLRAAGTPGAVPGETEREKQRGGGGTAMPQFC